MKRTRHSRFAVIAGTGVILLVLTAFLPEVWLRYLYNRTIGRFFRHSVESRLQSFGDAVRMRLQLEALPQKLIIIALKSEKQLELWGENPSGQPFFIKTKIGFHRSTVLSGCLHPKQRR